MSGDIIKVAETDFGTVRLFEAFIDGELVGSAMLNVSQEEIIALWVDSAYRRRSVATVLIEEVEASAGKSGMRRVFATVFLENEPSRALWKGRGYLELMKYEHWFGGHPVKGKRRPYVGPWIRHRERDG